VAVVATERVDRAVVRYHWRVLSWRWQVTGFNRKRGHMLRIYWNLELVHNMLPYIWFGL
jgi:hypothetical protein